MFLFEKLKRKIFRSSPLCRHFQSNDFLLSTSQLILILRGIRADYILIRERWHYPISSLTQQKFPSFEKTSKLTRNFLPVVTSSPERIFAERVEYIIKPLPLTPPTPSSNFPSDSMNRWIRIKYGIPMGNWSQSINDKPLVHHYSITNSVWLWTILIPYLLGINQSTHNAINQPIDNRWDPSCEWEVDL